MILPETPVLQPWNRFSTTLAPWQSSQKLITLRWCYLLCCPLMIIHGSPDLQPAEKIVALNKMIKDYADKNGFVYLDYFSAMSDERHGLKAGLGDDGVHPNLAGYKIMEPLVEKAIAEALKKK